VNKRILDAIVAASVPLVGTLVLLLMAKRLSPHDFAIYSTVATAQVFIAVLGGPVLFNLIDITLLRSAGVDALVSATVFVIRVIATLVCLLAMITLVPNAHAVLLGSVALFVSGIARTLSEYLCTHAGVSGDRGSELTMRALPGILTLLMMLAAYKVGTQLHVALLCVATSQASSALLIAVRLAPGRGQPRLAGWQMAYRAYVGKMAGFRLNLISVFIFAAPLIIYTLKNKGHENVPFVAFAMQMLNSGAAFYALLVSAQLRKTAMSMVEKRSEPLSSTALLKPLVTCLPVALLMTAGVLVYVRIKVIPVPELVLLVVLVFFFVELFQSYWTGVTFRGNFRSLEKCALLSALTNVVAALVISDASLFLLTMAASQLCYFLLPHLFSYGTHRGISRSA
jgi:hypothetical protein